MMKSSDKELSKDRLLYAYLDKEKSRVTEIELAIKNCKHKERNKDNEFNGYKDLLDILIKSMEYAGATEIKLSDLKAFKNKLK